MPRTYTDAKTFGELADFLATFPRDWAIAVPAEDGIPREQIVVNNTNIATVLTSVGEEIEF